METIENNHLGHFDYLPNNLGFDVHESNGATIIHGGLKTSMFSIVYGEPEDTGAGIDQIKSGFKGHPFAWWLPPSAHQPKMTKALLEKGFMIETIEHAMFGDLNNGKSFAQKTDLLMTPVTSQKMLADLSVFWSFTIPILTLFMGS